jgi:hypothetical protein
LSCNFSLRRMSYLRITFLILKGGSMSEAGRVVEAEKGNNLSPQNLHLRLRVVEVIVFLSLVLNLVQGYVAHTHFNDIQNQIDMHTQPR